MPVNFHVNLKMFSVKLQNKSENLYTYTLPDLNIVHNSAFSEIMLDYLT